MSTPGPVAKPSTQGPIEPGGVQQSPRTKIFLFAAGFFGWFLLEWLGWALLTRGTFETAGYWIVFNLLRLPVYLVVLLICFILRNSRMVGWGILGALAVNAALSLVLGLFGNVACFGPFFLN